MTAMILIAVALDLLLGDPRFLPHPVRGIGALFRRAEKAGRWIFPAHPRLAGLFALLCLITITAATATGILLVAAHFGETAHTAAGAVIIYYTIAFRDLAEHGMAVKRALTRDDLTGAGKEVAMIISRDPETMGREAIIRATVESMAENLVDAVTAPLFWAACFGPVAAAVYRTINTGDAMFGYKTEKYRDFGFFPARIDDLVNLIPARITGAVIPFAAIFSPASPLRSLKILSRDRNKHQSPNGGHPEAAVAGALGIRLGGPGNYFGKIINKPSQGDDLRPPVAEDISRTIILMAVAATIVTALLAAGRPLFILLKP